MYSLDSDAESLISELNQYESQLYTIVSEITYGKNNLNILIKINGRGKSLANKSNSMILTSELNSIRIDIGRLELN